MVRLWTGFKAYEKCLSPHPTIIIVTHTQEWCGVHLLQKQVPMFRKLISEVTNNSNEWKEYFEVCWSDKFMSVQHRPIILLLILDVIGVFVKGLEEKQQRLAFVQADSHSCSSLHTLSVAPSFPDDLSTWHGWVCFPWPEASAMEDIQTRKGQILQLHVSVIFCWCSRKKSSSYHSV